MNRNIGKRALAVGLSLSLAAGLCLPAGAAETPGAKWGYVNLKDQVVVPFQYEDATTFHGGFAAVKQNGKWGILNAEGQLVVPCQYSELQPEYDTDKAFFSTPNEDGTYRMLDSQGRTIGPDSYDFCNASGSTLVFECGEQWLAYRDDGTPLELPEGYLPSHEQQGVLIAFRGDYAGVLSLDGEVIVPAEYESVYVYPNTNLVEVQKGEQSGLYTLDGKEVVPCVCEDTNINYLDVRDVWYGTIGVAAFWRQGKTGLVSSDGETLFEVPYFASVIGREHGPFQVMSEEGGCGLIDSDGQLLTAVKYSFIEDFSDDLALASDGQWYGYLDTSGREAISFQFDDAGAFFQGLAPVEKDGRWYYIDKSGQEALTPEKDYDYLYSFDISGLAGAQVGENSMALIDRQGREVVAPISYTGAAAFSACFDVDGSMIRFLTSEGKSGFFKADGTALTPVGQLVSSANYEDGLLVVMNDGTGKAACYDQLGNVILPAGKYDQIGSAEDWDNGYGDGLFRVSTDDPDLLNQDGELHADAWAMESVKKAQAAGLIPASLQGADLTQTITRAEFAAVSVELYEAMSGKTAPTVTDNPFTDTSDPAVLQAYALGLTTGTSGTTFSPNANLTREQAATMLARVYTKLGGKLEGGETAFADAGAISDWAAESVSFMSGKGILNGVGDNKFAPAQVNQRQEALTLAVRMLETLGS